MYTYTQGFEKLLRHTDEKVVFQVKIGEYIRSYGVRSLLDIGAGDSSLARLLAAQVSEYRAVESKEEYVMKLQEAGLDTVHATFPVVLDGTYDLDISLKKVDK